ncbi:MAG: PrsW family glutamic-type intramembrane protease [Patescibacteria group bacterium]
MVLALTPIFLILLGLIPSVTWLFFYLHEDMKHPKPILAVLLTFLVGCAVTFLVLPVEIFANEWFIRIGFPLYTIGSFLVLAAIEEVFKFFGAFVSIGQSRWFQEPMDAMIYAITVALGFAAVENIASLFKASDGSFLNIDVIESLILRFVGATLLHSLAGGIAGYYWGKSFFKPAFKWGYIAFGLILVTALHAVFNRLIIDEGRFGGPAGLAIVFVSFVMFFVLSDFEKFKRVDR